MAIRRCAMSGPIPETPDGERCAGDHLRRRHACRLRWRTRPCGGAGVSCCSRCAGGPIRSGLPRIRTTGLGPANSAVSAGSRPRRVAATWPSSDRSCGRRSGSLRPDLRGVRLMPQHRAYIPRRRRSSAVGHRPAVRAARASGCLARRRSLRNCHAATARSAAARRANADRADIARGLALLDANEPVRYRPGRGGRQQPSAGGGGAGRHRPGAGARGGIAPQSAASARPRAAVSWSKLPRSARTIASTCRSIGPPTIEAAAAAGLAGVAVVAGSTIVAEPERIAAAADRAKIFVVGVNADGTDPMTTAAPGPSSDKPGELKIFLVAAEESGDRLGAALMRALRQRSADRSAVFRRRRPRDGGRRARQPVADRRFRHHRLRSHSGPAAAHRQPHGQDGSRGAGVPTACAGHHRQPGLHAAGRSLRALV